MDPTDLSAWNLDLNPGGVGGYPPNQPYQSGGGDYPGQRYGYPAQQYAEPTYPAAGFPSQPNVAFDPAPGNHGMRVDLFGFAQPSAPQIYPQAYPAGNAQTPFGMSMGPSCPQYVPHSAGGVGIFGSNDPYQRSHQPTYPADMAASPFGSSYRPEAPSLHVRQAGTSGGIERSGGTARRQPAVLQDVYAPSLKPYPNFNVNEDCERLRKAMKGMGTDEKTIIDIMGHRSVDQRMKIVLQFKTMYGKDLRKEFKSELSGHFHELVDALCQDATEFDASQLRKAIKGAGTDEEALIEILCTRTNEQIRNIKEKYSQLYPGRSLEHDVASDTSRHFKRLLVSMLQANRDESTQVDRQEARRDAEELYRAGEKRLGTDESTFNRIMAAKSFAYLKVVFSEYCQVSKRDIEKALKSEMSGDLLQAHLAIVRCIENKQHYFANQLKKSMKGLGTRDRQLIRIVVSRCEVDMERIKSEFLKGTGKTLQNWITDDTTGDYRRLLLTLVGN